MKVASTVAKAVANAVTKERMRSKSKEEHAKQEQRRACEARAKKSIKRGIVNCAPIVHNNVSPGKTFNHKRIQDED